MLRLTLGLAAAALLAATPLAAQMTAPPLQLADPALDGRRIEGDGVLGNYLPAAGTGRKAAILLLGGSEGALGAGALRQARSLQAAGFNVLQLSFFRGPGQNAALAHVPLETFARGLAWLRARPEVDARRIGLVGGSKGAEAVLVLAARGAAVRAVVAGMPSAYVWPAFSWDSTPVTGSSWSVRGKDLPALPYGQFDPKTGTASVYIRGIERAAAYPEAAIRIERSRAAILLVCGEADSLWPSCPMAAALKARDPRVTVLAYPDAGHSVFGTPLNDSAKLPGLAALGGTGAGNNAARADGWPKIVAFLRRELKATAPRR